MDIIMYDEPEQSKFFDLEEGNPKFTKCMDPSHDPPTHMVIPKGKGYRHVCPRCRKVTTIISQQINL
jgi:hypothetical protein